MKIDDIKPGMTAQERASALSEINAAQGNGPKEPTAPPLPPNAPSGLTGEVREKLSDCYVESVLSKAAQAWSKDDKGAVRAAILRFTEQS